MKHLDQNAGEESVTLKPQNSFYRRLQHQKIVDSGFHSESTGEGKERTVVVYRRPE
jgi:spoIIIJ-associated protein